VRRVVRPSVAVLRSCRHHRFRIERNAHAWDCPAEALPAAPAKCAPRCPGFLINHLNIIEAVFELLPDQIEIIG